MTDHHSVRFTLLDQQVVDADGRRIGRVDDLLCDDPGPGGEPVADHADLVHLRVRLADLPDVAGLERWLSAHVISLLPGAGDADQ
jgi:hypothetical protein